MIRSLLFLLAWISLTTACGLQAAEPRQLPSEQDKARTVYIFHHPIVMLQAKFGLTTPEERVLRIRQTLRSLSEDDIRQPVQVMPIKRYNQHGRLFTLNGKVVMLLTEGDLDEGDDLTLDQAAQRVLTRFDEQRNSLKDQYSSSYLATAAVKTLAGTLALGLLFYGAFKSWKKVKQYFDARVSRKKGLIPAKWREFLGAIESYLYGLLMVLLGHCGILCLAKLDLPFIPVDAGLGGIARRLVD